MAMLSNWQQKVKGRIDSLFASLKLNWKRKTTAFWLFFILCVILTFPNFIYSRDFKKGENACQSELQSSRVGGSKNPNWLRQTPDVGGENIIILAADITNKIDFFPY